MNRWLAAGLFAVAVWAGALGISVLVAEWRDDSAGDDISKLQAEVRTLRRDLEETKPLTVKPMSANTAGVHVDVERVTDERIEFILYGPHPGGLANSFQVVDIEGSVCSAGINASPGVPLGPGDKVHMYIYFGCAADRPPKTVKLWLRRTVPPPDAATFELSPAE